MCEPGPFVRKPVTVSGPDIWSFSYEVGSWDHISLSVRAPFLFLRTSFSYLVENTASSCWGKQPYHCRMCPWVLGGIPLGPQGGVEVLQQWRGIGSLNTDAASECFQQNSPPTCSWELTSQTGRPVVYSRRYVRVLFMKHAFQKTINLGLSIK